MINSKAVLATKLPFAAILSAASFACLTKNPALADGIANLGYPNYLLNILGVAYFLGVVGILQTRIAALQEWAYAGFSFALIGSISSHIFSADDLFHTLPSVFLLLLLWSAYFFEKRALAKKA